MVPTESWQAYRRSGFIDLRNMIVEANLGLVRKVAKRMAIESPEPIEDLEQIGEIGLIRAVERFDPGAGVAFSSFAVPHIRGEIMHWNRDHFGNNVKVPRRAFEEANRVRNTTAKIAEQGREVSPEVVAASYGLTAQKWEWVSEAVRRKPIVSLDELQIAAEDPDDDQERQMQYAKLHRAIARFPELKRRVVEDHWYENLTPQKIARRYKQPIAIIQRLLDEALADLKKVFLEDLPCDSLPIPLPNRHGYR